MATGAPATHTQQEELVLDLEPLPMAGELPLQVPSLGLGIPVHAVVVGEGQGPSGRGLQRGGAAR